MFLLLVACGTLYLVLGDVQEGLMLLGFVFVIMGIVLYQEKKPEKALDALKDLASPRTLVIRDGNEKRIAGESVPVRKNEWDMHLEIIHPGGDDLPFIYSGSLIVQGSGNAVRGISRCPCSVYGT